MKRLFILLAILLVSGAVQNAQAQFEEHEFEADTSYIDSLQGLTFEEMTDSVLKHVGMDSLSTNFLIDKAFQSAPLIIYDGSVNDSNHVDQYLWRRIYSSLHRSMLDTLNDTIPSINTLKPILEDIEENSQIALLLLDIEYERLKPTAISAGLLTQSGIQLFDSYPRESLPFEQRTCFAASVSKNYSEDTLTVEFLLHPQLFVSNNGKTVDYVKVDFDDGYGWRTLAAGTPVTISWDSPGTKYFQYQVRYADNTTRNGHSFFKANKANFYYSPNIYDTITSSKSYMGKYAQAYVTVALGCGNTQITKPLIVIEGFDPKQKQLLGERNWGYGDFLRLLDESNTDLQDNLETEGYDIIFIDFKNGADYIQANAYVVEEVIKWVNTKKAEAGSTNKNVIWGLSMGGVVGRYALVDMEENSEDHECSKLMTFDSPHRGANIPLGIQAAMHHLYTSVFLRDDFVKKHSKYFEMKQIEIAYSIFQNPATRQMLVYQTNQSNSLYQSFYNELENLNSNRGFPSNCPTVAIVNGSDNASGQNFWPYTKIIEVNANLATFMPTIQAIAIQLLTFSSLDIDIDIWSVPDPTLGNKKIYDGYFYYSIYGGLKFLKESYRYNVNGTLPIDNSPGGNAEMKEYTSGGASIPGLNIIYDFFCFVPTVSAASVKPPNQTNLFYDLQANNALATFKLNVNNYIAANGISPNPDNEPHLTLTSINEVIIRGNLINNFLYSIANQPAAFPSTLSSQTFNFGNNTTDRVKSITVGSNAALRINADEEVGLTGSSEPNPTTGSSFTAYTYGANCFGSSSIVVQNTGELSIGDNSVNNKGRLYITNGSSLTLQQGSSLIIADNSRLVIEPGAALYLSGTSTIELQGANSVIEIQGDLNISSGATFEYTGDGFIRFSLPQATPAQAINITGSGTFDIGAASMSDKIMEVTKGYVDIAGSLSQFKLFKGTVELGTDAYLDIHSETDLQQINFKSLNSASGHVHKGVKLNNQPASDITLKHCEFRNAKTGLLRSTSSSDALYMLGCKFFDCNKGVHTINGGADFKAVRFDNCSTAAWQAENMTELSDFTGWVEDCGAGLQFEADNTDADLYVYSTLFKNTTFAIDVIGDVTTTVRCSKFEDNYSNISVSEGILNLSTSQSVTRIGSPTGSQQGNSTGYGGDNAFVNTISEDISISSGAEDVYLDEGHNSFTYASNPAFVITGVLTNSYYSSNNFNVTDNYWSMYQTINGIYTNINYPAPASISVTYNTSSVAVTHTPTLSTLPANCSHWNGEDDLEEGGGQGKRADNSTGVKGIIKANPIFKFYPNPANDVLYLKSNTTEGTTVKLIDMLGREIYLVSVATSGNATIFNTSHLATGVYQVIVESNGSVVHKDKLVIAR